MFVLMFAVVFEAQNYGRFLLRSFAADLNGKLHCHVLENVWGMFFREDDALQVASG